MMASCMHRFDIFSTPVPLHVLRVLLNKWSSCIPRKFSFDINLWTYNLKCISIFFLVIVENLTPKTIQCGEVCFSLHLYEDRVLFDCL